MYSTDNGGKYIAALAGLTPNYLKTIPTCPAAAKDTYSASYGSHSVPDVYTFLCEGAHHRGAGMSPNYPQFNSLTGLIER